MGTVIFPFHFHTTGWTAYPAVPGRGPRQAHHPTGAWY
jgi:hypothetical protein